MAYDVLDYTGTRKVRILEFAWPCVVAAALSAVVATAFLQVLTLSIDTVMLSVLWGERCEQERGAGLQDVFMCGNSGLQNTTNPRIECSAIRFMFSYTTKLYSKRHIIMFLSLERVYPYCVRPRRLRPRCSVQPLCHWPGKQRQRREPWRGVGTAQLGWECGYLNIII